MDILLHVEGSKYYSLNCIDDKICGLKRAVFQVYKKESLKSKVRIMSSPS